MEESLFQNGKKYISSKLASSRTGYATDYIGQLCRKKKVDSMLVGRTWYVEENSINEHKNNFQSVSSRYISRKHIDEIKNRDKSSDSSLAKSSTNNKSPKAHSNGASLSPKIATSNLNKKNVPLSNLAHAFNIPATKFEYDELESDKKLKYFTERSKILFPKIDKNGVNNVKKAELFNNPIVVDKKININFGKKHESYLKLSPFQNRMITATAAVIVLFLIVFISGVGNNLNSLRSVSSSTKVIEPRITTSMNGYERAGVFLNDAALSFAGGVGEMWDSTKEYTKKKIIGWINSNITVDNTYIVNNPSAVSTSSSVVIEPIIERKTQYVSVSGSDRSYVKYVDQKIFDLKNYIDDSISIGLSQKVDRSFLSRQNDTITKLVASGSSSSGSSGSGIDLTDLSATSPITYNSGTGAFSFDFSTTNAWTGLNTFSNKIGLSTSSPYARLGVETQAGDILGFAVGSSTKNLLSVSTEGFGTTTLAGLNISGLATSTSNVGWNITTGCYAVNGTCISGSSGGLSSYDAWTHPAVGVSATTSELRVGGFVSTASSTIIGQSNLMGSVGVSSSTPYGLLSVNPNGISGPSFVIGSSTATSLAVTSGGTLTLGASVSPDASSGRLYINGSILLANQQAINYCDQSSGSCAARTVLTYDSSTSALKLRNNTNNSGGSILFENKSGAAEGARFTSAGYLGIGTTTPISMLTIASTTGSQITLSASTGINQWAFRNAGGDLFLSTTTVAGTATTSISALEIAGGGFGTTTVRGLNIANAQATSTSNVGWNITNGCYAINGVCLGTGAGTVTSIDASGGTTGLTFSGGPVTTSGTLTLSGTLGIANGGTNSTTYANNSLLFYNGTSFVSTSTHPLYVGAINATSTTVNSNFASSVGLASSTPWAQLSVNSDGISGPSFAIGSTTRTNFLVNNGGKTGVGTSSPFARLGVETQAGDILGFAVGSSTKNLLSVSTEGFGTTTLAGLNVNATATSTGNVGWNITNGCYAVNGTCIGGAAGASTFLALTDTQSSFTANRIIHTNSSGNALTDTAGFVFTGTSLGVATATPWAQISINPDGITGPSFAIGSSTKTDFVVTNSGNVGIGTTSPYAKLSVNGEIVGAYFTGTTTATSTFGGPILVRTIATDLSSASGLIIGSTSTPQIVGFDTINNRVQIGLGTGTASPKLFVLDTKNTSGDPTGVNGALYYNSNTNLIRCYINSAWTSCGGATTTRAVNIFGAFTVPDTGGNSWFQPYAITAVNDVFNHMVGIASSTAAKTGFYGTFHVPEDYNGASKVTIYWTAPLTTGDVVWDFDYRAISGDDAESLDQATFQESVTVTDTAPSAANERNSAVLPLTASNIAAGDTIEYYIARDGADGADTLASDAIIHDVIFEYSN